MPESWGQKCDGCFTEGKCAGRMTENMNSCAREKRCTEEGNGARGADAAGLTEALGCKGALG